MKIPKNIHKLSKLDCLRIGEQAGNKEGLEYGFQTALYLALAGYYNTKPDDIISDEEFGEWSKKAEAECVRIFNEMKEGFDVSKQAIKPNDAQESIEDSIHYGMSKINNLREHLNMEKWDEV